ncbi:DUF6484 domain-containing protein [Tumebacillus flagellatus]|uniref:DUF6484 domain-containing protein n=1 Tax=Tumebacillus flagellatus TaxID=1157490 RepID=A0A074LFL0_9BACL|nr:DUF6484 domain-containing protein [Tumebacillus flagellatus]KEO81031.1 hypothetical protein EL26_22900 [Tumebacillus flagellatus]
MNNSMPQKGVITTVRGNTAQVLVPLINFETGFAESCKNLAPEMEGHECVVVFINGDLNQPVIMGVILDG